MKHYRITLEGHTFDIEVLDDPRQRQVRVRVDGQVFAVEAEVVESGRVESDIVQSAQPESVVPAAPPSPASKGAGAVGASRLLCRSCEVHRRAARPAGSCRRRVARHRGDEDGQCHPRHARGTVGTIHVAEGRQVAHGEPLLDLAGRES